MSIHILKDFPKIFQRFLRGFFDLLSIFLPYFSNDNSIKMKLGE